MKREELDLSEGDGYEALQGHIATKASLARERYGPTLSLEGLLAMLKDRDIVRHPTQLVYDSSQLGEGEFGVALPVKDQSPRAYHLILHESFQGKGAESAMLAAYHIPTINYLDIVTHEEAELFGAVFSGMEKEAYYTEICRLADQLKA
jgi:hypothetical protein